VVVHHAARMPSTSDGRQAVVVFLEAGLHQYELARRCVLKLPWVSSVSFSGHTSTIMYVFGAEPGGRKAPIDGTQPRPDPQRRRQQIRALHGPGPVRLPEAERRLTIGRRQN
jgi:hypothetical protein